MPFVEVEGFEPSYMPEHVHSCPWCYALLLRQYIRAMLLIVLRTGCSSHVSTTAHLLPFIDSDFFLKSVVLRLKHFHVLPALPFPVGSNLTLTSLRPYWMYGGSFSSSSHTMMLLAYCLPIVYLWRYSLSRFTCKAVNLSAQTIALLT